LFHFCVRLHSMALAQLHPFFEPEDSKFAIDFYFDMSDQSKDDKKR
jgi:hypothetical protein